MGDAAHLLSKRTGWDLSVSAFSAAVAKARRSGIDLVDLTISNPTMCGFDYDAEGIFGPLDHEGFRREALVYDPDPCGMRSAREAVAQYYAGHGARGEAAVDPDSVVLTTSTSEAYSFLFRLLCDPSDEVLVAQPSYPLFDYLADLDDVTLRPYPLFYDFGWWIDFAELERRIGQRTRAILVVHPNNPTGHWTRRAEREQLEVLCERHGLALIVDEVFLDYPIQSAANSERGESFAIGPHPVLTFVLSGISKIAALPQMKAAWVVTRGPAEAAAEAMARLEVVADTFLSMNVLVQLAMPGWLSVCAPLQQQIRDRVASNLKRLRESRLEMLDVEAGWTAIVRLRGPVGAGFGERDAREMLLDHARVIVHPGSFYGMSDGRAIVVSLITPNERFEAGVERIAKLFRG